MSLGSITSDPWQKGSTHLHTMAKAHGPRPCRAHSKSTNVLCKWAAPRLVGCRKHQHGWSTHQLQVFRCNCDIIVPAGLHLSSSSCLFDSRARHDCVTGRPQHNLIIVDQPRAASACSSCASRPSAPNQCSCYGSAVVGELTRVKRKHAMNAVLISQPSPSTSSQNLRAKVDFRLTRPVSLPPVQ